MARPQVPRGERLASRLSEATVWIESYYGNRSCRLSNLRNLHRYSSLEVWPMHCVSPATCSRQNAASFPPENHPVQSLLGHGPRDWGRPERRRAPTCRAVPNTAHMSCLGEQSVLRASVRRSESSPRGTLRSVRQISIQSNGQPFPQEPLLRLRPATSAHIFVQKDAGRVEKPACTGAFPPAPCVIHSAH